MWARVMQLSEFLRKILTAQKPVYLEFFYFTNYSFKGGRHFCATLIYR